MLVPLFSIRSPSGWGTGEIPDLPRFSAWARDAGFSIVQLLPTMEVCGGETSPYAAASAFALDPVYLGLDDCEDFQRAGGLASLSAEDRALRDELAETERVDWPRVRALKDRAARHAFDRFLRDEWRHGTERAAALRQFQVDRGEWLHDHALFAVLHDEQNKHWCDWPEELRDRFPEALAAAREQRTEALLFKVWLQWQLDLQWHKARDEARAMGVDFMGDLPFVVSGDSADVWAHRDLFRVDLRVGTPPDAFSAEGQDWGLPVYDWDVLERSDYAWIRARARRSGQLYGSYRVDHVIGLYRTFYRNAEGVAAFTPEEESDQIRLGETLIRIFSEAGEVVAEDLGMVPAFLRPSLTKLKVPGYKVLRWEKDDERYHDPSDWPAVSVATSGTHDTETQAEWWDALTPDQRANVAKIPGLEALDPARPFDGRVRDALLRVLYASPSEIVALPLQDALGTRERVNVPGTVTAENWTFRIPRDLAALRDDRPTTDWLRALAAESGRAPLASATRQE